ncbi:MAG: monofunctional biosynthetic peptidoglycan transglycosylase [Sporocytophaga sp.]|nr:monofunctional biosynthetic peptidoglycan transglycosylase [Sporocytophaga sp.]MBO9702467.1 monofunctional biosynthetic peptidoglycan transglycosylase [Sporocytophaga sp.]
MKMFWKKCVRIIKLTTIFFLVSTLFSVIILRFVPPIVSPLMIIRCFEQIWNGKSLKLKKDWVSFDEISPNLKRAVIASEDQRFMDHHGFDFNAIKKAMEYNKKGKKKVVGASTISQQVAKNVFLWPSRSWVRKGFEVYFTILIEIFWSKERILEVYLNIVELGNGVYGAEAASHYYFNINAKKLSRDQAALLAAILPNPLKWSPTKPSIYILKRRNWIRQNMARMGKVEFS